MNISLSYIHMYNKITKFTSGSASCEPFTNPDVKEFTAVKLQYIHGNCSTIFLKAKVTEYSAAWTRHVHK